MLLTFTGACSKEAQRKQGFQSTVSRGVISQPGKNSWEIRLGHTASCRWLTADQVQEDSGTLNGRTVTVPYSFRSNWCDNWVTDNLLSIVTELLYWRNWNRINAQFIRRSWLEL